MRSASRPSAWPSALALLAATVIPLLVFASTSGQCLDAAPGTGDGFCTSGPSVGWPGAWLITAVCAVVLAVSAARLLRLLRGRSQDATSRSAEEHG